MIKRVFVSLSAFIFLLVAGIVYGFLISQKSEDAELFKLSVGGQFFEVEIADDFLEQARGLSGRGKLAENQGMLFVFDNQDIRSFWMVGMKFPLDIIWIRGDEAIGFSENLPPAAGSDYSVYSSPEPADKVLEINAALVKKLGLKIGDKLLLE